MLFFSLTLTHTHSHTLTRKANTMNTNTMKKARSIRPANVIERDKKIAMANNAQTLELRRNSYEARALASFIEHNFQKNEEMQTFDFVWDALSAIETRTNKKTQNGENIGAIKTSVIPRGLKGEENMLNVYELSIDLAQKVLEKCFPHSVIYWTCDNIEKAGDVTIRQIISNRMKLVIHAKRRTPRAYIGAKLNARPIGDDKMLQEIAFENYMAFAED